LRKGLNNGKAPGERSHEVGITARAFKGE